MSHDFAQHLRQAAPYIHSHNGDTCVAYWPGEAVQRDDFAAHLFDLALAHGLGLNLILVIGARPQIQQRLEQANIAQRMHQGLRVTDAATLHCVKEAVGALRGDIEALLSTALAQTPLGGRRIEVVSGNLVTAKPGGVRDGVDMQFTGEIRRLAVDAIQTHLERRRIVLLPCLGTSSTGESFNLRSEDLAVAAAAQLRADQLLVMSPRPVPAGECAPQDLHNRSDIPSDEATIAAAAVAAGVPRIQLLPLDQPGVILNELYTQAGQGLLVSAAASDHIRQAGIEDLAGLLNLIAPLEAEGTLVERSREQLELDMEHFAVIEHDGQIIGCRALLPMDDGLSAELACVAVHSDWRSAGRAAALLQHAEQSARARGIQKLYVLTTRAIHWFVEQGFSLCEPSALPVSRQSLYNWQRASKVLVKTL